MKIVNISIICDFSLALSLSLLDLPFFIFCNALLASSGVKEDTVITTTYIGVAVNILIPSLSSVSSSFRLCILKWHASLNLVSYIGRFTYAHFASQAFVLPSLKFLFTSFLIPNISLYPYNDVWLTMNNIWRSFFQPIHTGNNFTRIWQCSALCRICF